MEFVGNYASCGLSPQTDGMPVIQEKRQNPHKYWILALNKQAADGNRTRDLRLTKATLYRLSHSSLFSLFSAFCVLRCQRK